MRREDVLGRWRAYLAHVLGERLQHKHSPNRPRHRQTPTILALRLVSKLVIWLSTLQSWLAIRSNKKGKR
jgi:hypothetical protein